MQLAVLPALFLTACAIRSVEHGGGVSEPSRGWSALCRLGARPRPLGLWDKAWAARYEWAFFYICVAFYLFDFAAANLELKIVVHHVLSLALHSYIGFRRCAGFPFHLGGVAAFEVGTGFANLYSASRSSDARLLAYAVAMTWSNAYGVALALRWRHAQAPGRSTLVVILLALFMAMLRQMWCCVDVHRHAWAYAWPFRS
jgi:hypothetical protein